MCPVTHTRTTLVSGPPDYLPDRVTVRSPDQTGHVVDVYKDPSLGRPPSTVTKDPGPRWGSVRARGIGTGPLSKQDRSVTSNRRLGLPLPSWNVTVGTGGRSDYVPDGVRPGPWSPFLVRRPHFEGSRSFENITRTGETQKTPVKSQR